MTINTALLKTTNDLQQYFVDKKTGLPLAAGIVTLYKDNSRTFLKNWYYQSGQAPNYTYLPLPNPLTLSSVGTIIDVNGTDVLPFYYPVSEIDGISPETYYITVDSADGARQFTRQNFPFDTSTENPNAQISTLQNLIVNNNFWRNIGSKNLTAVTSTVATGGLSPSAHDGFSMPDLQFFKDIPGAVETVTFLPFLKGSTPLLGKGDITPEFYLNHHCTTAGTESIKYYQIPIVLHIKNLESEEATFTIDAQSLGSSASSVLQFGIYQFTGTTNSPAAAPVITGTFNITPTLNKYTHSFKFPRAAGVTISSVGDDAFYLVIFIPPAQTCNISFTQPSIYLGDTVPTNNFQTYDVSDSIIDSPRTGDFRIANNFYNKFGWVPANDGTIGALTPVNSNATTRCNNDTWPLYNLYWNNFPEFFVPVSGGRTPSGTAYGDFVAGKTLTLPIMLASVLGGANAGIAGGFNFTTTGNSLVFSPVLPVILTAGTPIVVTGTSLPAPLLANNTYYALGAPLTDPQFVYLATTLENAVANINIVLTSSGTGKLWSANGCYTGQSVTSQVPNHVHTFTSDLPPGASAEGYMGIYGSDQGGQNLKSGADFYTKFSNVPGTTNNNTGGVSSISLYQPTAFVNFYIKL